MGHKIIVCGGNGAGKSTLGRVLADRLSCKFADIEGYYFPEPAADYPYETVRTRDEVRALLLADLRTYDNLVLASVKGDFGAEVEALLTAAVFVSVPKELRMKRVRDRSFSKFGGRMLPGGDLYERECQFFDLVSQRPELDGADWLETASLPALEVDGTRPADDNAEVILRWLRG